VLKRAVAFGRTCRRPYPVPPISLRGHSRWQLATRSIILRLAHRRACLDIHEGVVDVDQAVGGVAKICPFAVCRGIAYRRIHGRDAIGRFLPFLRFLRRLAKQRGRCGMDRSIDGRVRPGRDYRHEARRSHYRTMAVVRSQTCWYRIAMLMRICRADVKLDASILLRS